MPKSLKKTIIYSNEETKDIIEKTMEELNVESIQFLWQERK